MGCVGVFAILDHRRVRTTVRTRHTRPRLQGLRGLVTHRIAIVMRNRGRCSGTIGTARVLFNGSASRALHDVSRRAFLSVFSKIPAFRLDGSMLPTGVVSLLTIAAGMFPSGKRYHGVLRNNNISVGGSGISDTRHVMATRSLVSKGCVLTRGNGGGCCVLGFRWCTKGQGRSPTGDNWETPGTCH